MSTIAPIKRPKNSPGRGKCATCAHPKMEEINKLLIVGRTPMKEMERRYGISDSSLAGHKADHISVAVKAVQQARIRKGVRTVVVQLEDLIAKAEIFLTMAEDTHNINLGLQAIRELRPTIELLAKVTGELDTRPTTVINLLVTKEWLEIRTALVESLEPYPEAFAAVAARLQLAA
jgi:hypothetical protein